ncbi:response regulator [Acidovorax sp. Root217]|uniref:tetratricopeptide repeat protein n=1 Tax=Acidovorax sp. Root217 TaxID=1736492 RepID=UPI00070E751F|nr:response regulator [Acidovorax sp. Root217]KRC16849.1 response regulator receiver protein [Acidovorax sp. Root217]
MATGKDPDTPDIQALIIDSNATSRSILVGQLREYGVTKIVQCSRVRDARARLEHTVFDYVLCDQFFSESGDSGQTLLDDLRRAQLLPFSTVFFMVTAEASYAAVAEAAESALDGYLLKPFTPSALFERLSLARLRKIHLKPIFDAIEQEDFELASSLCVERFEARKPYWLYAARIGTELLLRLGRHDEARTLFEAVIAARALPWAKLGVARAQIESGQATRAITTLQGLIGEDASFADAYDVLGRAQVELGNFTEAIETYRTASALTPDSVVRLQKLGMMSYYMGDRKTAASVLSRAAILGIDSKLFDFQALVLLAFSYFSDKDRKGIERCVADFGRILERHQDSPRIQRFASIAQTLLLIQQRQFSAAVAAVRDMAREIDEASFDFEAACNLASLLAVLAATSIDLSDGEKWVRSLGMRYANTRGLTELMANACNVYPAYSDMVRECLPQINQSAEKAMAQSLAGDAEGAVRKLLQLAESSLNSKLADMAQQVLLRHRERIADAQALQDSVQAVRARCGNAPTRAVLGQDGERRPGGVVIRTRTPPPPEAAASAALAAIAARVELSADQILDMPDEPSIDEILGVPTPEPHDPAEKLRLRPM